VKILCLIVDSTPHGDWLATYEVHRRNWNRCLDRCPDVDGYFLRSEPELAVDHSVEGRCFTVRNACRHDTMLFKARKAIETLLGDHDFVVRTNLSSIFDFPLLQRQRLPDEGLYMGHLVESRYVTGSGMVLSRDVAQMLVSPSSQPLDAWEDIATWQILSARGVTPSHREALIYDYGKGLEQVSVGHHLHYRLRDYTDPQRIKERAVAEHVFNQIYKES
jgi:hypothetical protein